MRKKNEKNYGSFDCNYKSLPNMSEHSIGVPYADDEDEENLSDIEQDPVANNYDISDLVGSFSEQNETTSFQKKDSSYIIEPVAFVQNLAASTMTVSVGQFVYTRIYKRLLREASHHHQNTTMNYTTNHFTSSKPILECNQNSSNATLLKMYNSYGHYKGDFFYNFLPVRTAHQQPATDSVLYSFFNSHKNLYSTMHLTPYEMNRIRNEAQMQTANLYFYCALYAAIPIIFMTNILGVNCSCLGRKTLILINQFTLILRYLLYLLQCVFEDWPDWLFYAGSFIESLSGSQGIFYLALYCFITDLTPAKERSYRITFINNLNAAASLCMTGICGYVIKYYGYFYLFLTSWLLVIIAFIYTLTFIPEPLAELHDKTFWDRLWSCSLMKSSNCIKVYFNKSNEDQETSLLNKSSVNLPTKQTAALLLVVFTNLLYVFGTQGISSIFTLYVMNAPYCFDSIEISQFSIFTTVVSLVMCLFVSKFIRINDMIICAVSCTSYFASIFCYVYGDSKFFVYLGSAVASLGSLQYGYARSIVSKSMGKAEVSDALSLILIVDTIVAVLSLIIFPVFYSKIVAKGINLIFYFSNVFVLIALLLNILNYFIYKPVKHVENDTSECNEDSSIMSENQMFFNPMTHSMLRSVDTI